MVESGLLQEGHLGELFAFFCCRASFWAFFFISGVLAHGGETEDAERRETLQNKAFRSDIASLGLFDSLLTCCAGLILQNYFENHFCGSYKSVFSEVWFFDQIGLWGQKNLGAPELRSFWKWLFSFFWQAPIWGSLGARVCQILGSSQARCQKWPCGCGAEGFCDFFGVFVSTPWRFCQYEEDLFKLPSSSFHVFLFSAFFSWVWGQCTLHLYFGHKASPFLSLFKEQCSPRKRGIFPNFWVSLSFTLFFPLFRLSFSLFCCFCFSSFLVFIFFRFFLLFPCLVSWLYFMTSKT